MQVRYNWPEGKVGYDPLDSGAVELLRVRYVQVQHPSPDSVYSTVSEL